MGELVSKFSIHTGTSLYKVDVRAFATPLDAKIQISVQQGLQGRPSGTFSSATQMGLGLGAWAGAGGGWSGGLG